MLFHVLFHFQLWSISLHLHFYPNLQYFINKMVPWFIISQFLILYRGKCSKNVLELLYSFVLTEILRVSGMIPNQGLSDFDRLRGSPSPAASSDLLPNYRGTGISGWHGLSQDVSIEHLSVQVFLFLPLMAKKCQFSNVLLNFEISIGTFLLILSILILCLTSYCSLLKLNKCLKSHSSLGVRHGSPSDTFFASGENRLPA